MVERLQKVMAHYGIASRRKCEEMIRRGCVKVNGRVVQEMGVKVHPGVDRIEVDGVVLRTREPLVYFMLNKPEGVITTLRDPKGRRTVADLLAEVRERVYPVGRLDYDTEGLLLLTNDGEVAYALTHPSHQVEKGYLAEVEGEVTPGDLERLRRGILLEDGWTAPAKANLIHRDRRVSVVELRIHEGRNRQVRRMFAALGHPVVKLQRFRFGPLDLSSLKPGEYRRLSVVEERSVKRLADRVLQKSEGKHGKGSYKGGGLD